MNAKRKEQYETKESILENTMELFKVADENTLEHLETYLTGVKSAAVAMKLMKPKVIPVSEKTSIPGTARA